MKDFSLIPPVLRRDPEYPEGIKYPFYTHKHSRGNGTHLVWICEECGYTSEFSYRNDLTCNDGVFFCKRCRCSQMLTLYYNGQYRPRVCCECKQGDELEEWNGDVCPKCGGKVRQFNAAEIKQNFKNYNYNYADKNVTIFDTIREKGEIKKEGINKIIADYIQQEYNINAETATPEQFGKVERILVRDKTMNHDYDVWDFSDFPNLKVIDCSYNPIDKLIISKNLFLEELSWEGARGGINHALDLSHNPHLKKIRGGQDNIVQLDLSSNHELEQLSIFLSSSMRWLDLSGCTNLCILNLTGVIIPFIDLTNCRKLEELDVNYWNLYKNKYNEFGPGFPRPFVFVNEDFNEDIIAQDTRRYDYYTYYLIRVKSDSPEENFLNELKAMKEKLISIPDDGNGTAIALFHYSLLDRLKELRNKN